MARPVGTLTAAQHEILDVIWNSSDAGATVTEIWHSIGRERELARTTVLNQVDRLEKRCWLRRHPNPDGFRYFATRTRQQVSRGLVEEFVNSFFGGSASDLVLSLLGSDKLGQTDLARLKALIEGRSSKRNPKGL